MTDEERPNELCWICEKLTVPPYGAIGRSLAYAGTTIGEFLMHEGSRHAGKAFCYDFKDMKAEAIEEGLLTAEGKFKEGFFFGASICVACFDDLIDKGVATPRPRETCLSCKKEFDNVDGWCGDTLDEKSETYLGYGSAADGDQRRFKLAPGWYCHDCLDIEYKEGRTEFVSAYLFLNDLRKDQPRDSVETYKQLLHSARNDLGVMLSMMENLREEFHKKYPDFKMFDSKIDDRTDSNILSLLLMRRRVEYTTKTITELLGDAEWWKDGKSAT